MGKRAGWNWQRIDQKATRWAGHQEHIPRECIAQSERPLASMTDWLASATGIHFLSPGGQEPERKLRAGRGSSEGLSPWLVNGHLLHVSSCGLTSVPVC